MYDVKRNRHIVGTNGHRLPTRTEHVSLLPQIKLSNEVYHASNYVKGDLASVFCTHTVILKFAQRFLKNEQFFIYT